MEVFGDIVVEVGWVIGVYCYFYVVFEYVEDGVLVYVVEYVEFGVG